MKRKIIVGTIFFISFITYFFLLQRYDYALWAILSIVFLNYSSRYLQMRNIAIAGVAFIAVFYWVSNIRLAGTIANYTYLASEMKYPLQYAVFTEPYMYFVTNLENFCRAVVRLDQHTYGYYTFEWIGSLTGLRQWVAQYFDLKETPYLNSGFNMYGFLWPFYRDFGVVGLVSIPFIEGSLISLLYYRLRSDANIMLVSMYGLAVFAMVFSFFNHAPVLLHFVFNTGLIYLISRSIVLRSSNAKHALPAMISDNIN